MRSWRLVHADIKSVLHSMTVFIEGLHRTSRLRGGYVEGVKVTFTTVSKLFSILPPSPLSDHKCHLMIRLRANVPSQNTNVIL